jgi:hypothetical protein
MKNNFCFLAILVFISMTATFSTCKKGGLGCVNNVYNFRTEAQAYPDKDSIKLGDTLWIKVNSLTTLIDLNSNQTVDFSGASNLGNAISIVKFTGNGSISDPAADYAANDFKYVAVIGVQVNNPFIEGIREYLFAEDFNQYKFKLAIIPQKIGVYSIGISNSVNVGRQSDKCTKAGFEFYFANTDQHLYLLQKNRPGYVISEYERAHLYCFKVY